MPKSEDTAKGRRAEPRISARLSLMVTVRDPRTGLSSSHSGHTLNISLLGLTFVMHEPIALMNVSDLQIEPPMPLKPFIVRGWLAWEDEKSGIYGVNLSEENASLKETVAFFGKITSADDSAADRRQDERRLESRRKLEGRTDQTERRTNNTKRISKADFSMFDRRSSIRIHCELPAQVILPDSREINGVLESFSENGLCLRLPEKIPDQSPLNVHLKLNGGPSRTFHVKWTWHFPFKADHRYGARFFEPSSQDIQNIREYLFKALKTPGSVSDRRLRSTIVSELVSYSNRQGKKIVGFHDHRAASAHKEDPLIIIPSAYAETKKDALHLSYYLVTNGFQVLRYDNTNHTGESDGDILNITLNQFKDDILSSVDYAEKALKIPKVGIVSLSLSARTAIKAASQDKRIAFLLGLVAAVDVRYTLNAVYCEDLVGTYKNGKLWGVTNVLGCNTYLDAFLQDAIDQKYDGLESTVEDVSKIKIPFVLLATELDPWVRFEDVSAVMATCPSPNKEVHLIPAMHQLKENPKAAQAAFRLIVSSAVKYLLKKDLRPLSVIEPSMRWLAVQNRIERQRMKLFSSFEKKENQSFWTHYLDQFHFINELPDYRQLLQAQYESLHGLHPGEKVLDAGCGNGTFGLWFLANLALQSKSDLNVLASTFSRPIEFHSVDYVREALDVAKTSHATLQDQLYGQKGQAPVHFAYRGVDLEKTLPFADRTFNKISCNLVISYVEDPVATLREFIRVTAPGGRIAVSTLKPYADTSQIYRNYVQVAPGEDRVENTRKLLNNAGDIRLKETEGHFSFFSEDELTEMARAAGASDIQVLRAFANQANVLIIQV